MSEHKSEEDAKGVVSEQSEQIMAAYETAIRLVVDENDNVTDAKDWIRARSFFSDKINTDFTSLNGGKPAKITADALIETWATNLFEAKKTRHLRSKHSITIDGDRAEVFSKAYAFNLLETGDVIGLWAVWGNTRTRSKKPTSAGNVRELSSP